MQKKFICNANTLVALLELANKSKKKQTRFCQNIILHSDFRFFISMYSLNIVDQKINNIVKASIFQLLTKNINPNILENFIIKSVN